MPLYLRKSLRVGPLRFNLSKSGIGISAGITGFRFGMGPRGNYVHAGRGGIYYRATLPSGRQRNVGITDREPTAQSMARPPLTTGPEQEIESGSVLAMHDESAAAVLEELDEKRRRWRVAPVVVLFLFLSTVAAWDQLNPVRNIAVLIGAIVAALGAFLWDKFRKTTVIMYDLDVGAETSYQALLSSLEQLGQAHRLWHVESKAEVLDQKYHAGATSELRRRQTRVAVGPVPFVRCNVDVAGLAVGRQVLYFFPDRLLVFDSGSVGAINYGDLRVLQHRTRFIEGESVPPDSRVVDRTWRYVNKNGGPDKRFSNNREIPICEYESVHFQSTSGLNELVHASRVGAADALVRYLAAEGVRLGKQSTEQRDLNVDPIIAEYIRKTDEAVADLDVHIKNMEDQTINNPEWVKIGSADDEDDEVILNRANVASGERMKGKVRPSSSDDELLAEIAKLRSQIGDLDQLSVEEEQKREANEAARDSYLDDPNGQPPANWVDFDDTHLRRLQTESRQLNDRLMDYVYWRLHPGDSDGGREVEPTRAVEPTRVVEPTVARKRTVAGEVTLGIMKALEPRPSPSASTRAKGGEPTGSLMKALESLPNPSGKKRKGKN